MWRINPVKSSIEKYPLYFSADYNEFTGSVILEAKESANKVAIDLLACSIARSIIRAIKDLSICQPIVLTTIPSQHSANRRRGRDHIKDLTEVIIGKLEAIDIFPLYLPLLIPSKKIQDQSKLNSQQRKVNVYQAFLARQSEISIGGVILIDDLVTTGASILEGVRALNEAKITINAVVTACAVGRNSLIR
jgi:predicted amidophosphoribosyltransferase